jgi:predicted Zn-dependent protease
MPDIRMHNTFLAAGSDDEDEMIRSFPKDVREGARGRQRRGRFFDKR